MAANVMLKFAIAGVALALGIAATGTPVFAAPRNDDCADCAPPTRYDSEEVIQKIRSMDHSIPNEAPIDIRTGHRGDETKRIKRARNADCADCPPPRTYEDRKVVKKVRDIDRSRVINTVTVVPVGRRIAKEPRHVRYIPIQTRVEIITHNYRVVERPDTVAVEVPRRVRDCGRRSYGRYGSCGPVLRVRG
jgi:hypothetical protein